MNKSLAYNHNEAFCRMQYRDDKTGEIEWIWNSRDGVTPFTVMNRDGTGSMTHVKWSEDVCDPDFIPPIGSRIFTNVTKEDAREAALRVIERSWNDPMYPMSKAYDSKEAAAVALIPDIYGNGTGPVTTVVTEEIHTRWRDKQTRV